MRKSVAIPLLLLLALGVGGYLFLNPPTVGGAGVVEEQADAFLRAVQFKDFRAASLSHHPMERDRVDIGRSIERLFFVKPELLDIKDYEIVRTDVDEGGRARALVRARTKKLNADKKYSEQELMLYFIQRHPDCPLGSECREGECIDEFGKVIYRPKDDDASRNVPGRDYDVSSDEKTELTRDVYRCDASVDPQWWMNLDSTLKDKKYR